ncbi:MAG: TlpA family protein disulfide reductase [Sedimenticola sp.]|nr:TlpA family protein disulfide reductase [Sedimenticola sp.]
MGKWLKSMNRMLVLGMLLMGNHVVADANDAVLYDLSGAERTFDEFRGKWLLVNYWATWCVPCLEEIPELNKFHAKHFETDAVVVGINMEGFDVDVMRDFLRDQGVVYPVWITAPSDYTAFGVLPGIPTSYLISPKGEVVAKQVGVISAEMIERFISR